MKLILRILGSCGEETMQKPIKIVPLEDIDEKSFYNYLDKDRIRHIFTIYDLKNMREKTRVWVALRNSEITGYLFEFERRFVHTHGDPESVSKLIGQTELDEPVLVVYPEHLTIVTEVFEPVEPLDSASKGKITTFLVMIVDAASFRPVIKHPVKKLGANDLDEIAKSLGEEYRERVQNAVDKGFAFGAYENGYLASVATVPELLEDEALIRGVYTAQVLRSRGLATSACSALVVEIIRYHRKPILWVSKDNLPALNVYKKLGFKETDIVLLCFKARRTREPLKR